MKQLTRRPDIHKTPKSVRKAIKDSHSRNQKLPDGALQGTIPHPDEIYYALNGEQDPEEDDEDDEKVGLQDSLWFPLIASCALFGFFLLFKFLDPLWINWIISIYCEFRFSIGDSDAEAVGSRRSIRFCDSAGESLGTGGVQS